MIRDRAGSPDCAMFVADLHGVVIGCGGVTIATRLPGPRAPTARFAYVQWLVTDPAHRRRGHARAIFAAILEWIQAHEVRVIELHATPDGESLYRSFGFETPAFPQLRAVFDDRSTDGHGIELSGGRSNRPR